MGDEKLENPGRDMRLTTYSRSSIISIFQFLTAYGWQLSLPSCSCAHPGSRTYRHTVVDSYSHRLSTPTSPLVLLLLQPAAGQRKHAASLLPREPGTRRACDSPKFHNSEPSNRSPSHVTNVAVTATGRETNCSPAPQLPPTSNSPNMRRERRMRCSHYSRQS